MADAIWVAIIGGIIGPIVVLSIKWWFDRKGKAKPSDMIMEALQVGELIDAKMEELKEDYLADRVWLAQFHNGGHFYPTGKSIAKFSIFYEAVSTNAPSMQMELKNIPVALFSKSFNRLLESDHITIYDFADIDTSTYGLRNFANEYKTKSQYLFAIKNFDGKFIAILGLDYTLKKTKLSDDQLENILHTSFSMGGVLSNHLKVH